MAHSLHAHKQADGHPDCVFQASNVGKHKECLVLPPSNFALLGLKDVVDMLLQGYRVLCVVQPRFYRHYQMFAEEFTNAGILPGMLDILPGITPDADPQVLHYAVNNVSRLQFTGSSAMFKSLVLKAHEMGNLGLDYAGEISGVNKIRVSGVSVLDPTITQSAAFAVSANHGEYCTSASAIEVDTAHCSLEDVKTAIEGVNFTTGSDVSDASLDLLARPEKMQKSEVLISGEVREFWDKKVVAVPIGDKSVDTNQALTYCVYAPTSGEALDNATDSDASNVNVAQGGSLARVGTTGSRQPFCPFGGQKSYTYAVAGDHDGVASVQHLVSNLSIVPMPQHKAKYLAHSDYELTDASQTLLEFLNATEQASFPRELGRIIDTYETFCREPHIAGPYEGQPFVDGSGGRTQLVTLRAIRPTRPQVILTSQASTVPDDLIKLAMVYDMSPLKAPPFILHYLGVFKGENRRIEDPLKLKKNLENISGI